MDKLKRALSGDDEEDEQGIVTQIYEGSTLSWSSRIKGFCVCFILGVVLSILGTISITLGTNLIMFAILYTLGNIISLGSTCFLMGPVNQLKKMFAETRIIATIIVLICFLLTLMAAIWWGRGILAILFCVLQFVAMTWWCSSVLNVHNKLLPETYATDFYYHLRMMYGESKMFDTAAREWADMRLLIE